MYKVRRKQDGIDRPEALVLKVGLLLVTLDAEQHDALVGANLRKHLCRLAVQVVAAHVALG